MWFFSRAVKVCWTKKKMCVCVCERFYEGTHCCIYKLNTAQEEDENMTKEKKGSKRRRRCGSREDSEDE